MPVREQRGPLHPKLRVELENMFVGFRRAIEGVNVIIPTCGDEPMG